MRILLVEDNPGDARLVREMVRELPEPVELVHVSRLDEAIRQLEIDHVDLVLLDLGLPDAAGISALLRIGETAPNVPLVVLTGTSEDEIAVEALRAGAQEYLVKGEVDARLLRKTLQYAVERKRIQVADHFMAEAGHLLVGTLDYQETLGRIGELLVHSLADLCIIDLAGEDGVIERLHVAHSGRVPADLARDFREYPLDRSRPYLLLRALESGRPVHGPVITEQHLREIAQDERHLQLLRRLGPRSFIAVPLIAHDNLLGGIVLVAVTREYGAAEQSLAERLAQLAALGIENAALYRRAQRAVRARDRVLGVVAHDLRNPLGVVTMVADLLLEGRLAPEQTTQQLQILRRSATRMDRLIQDLLDVVRLDADTLVLNREYRDAAGLAAETVELNGALAAMKAIRLTCQVEGVPGPVLADHDRVLRILENLVGNAIKFTPEGGRVVVRVEPDAGGDGARYSVVDTGPGIPEEELPNLFRPFWQARRGPTSGAGLGLAISRGLVEAHGGRIWAESTPGVGTTMSFTLPAAEDRRGERDDRGSGGRAGAGDERLG